MQPQILLLPLFIIFFFSLMSAFAKIFSIVQNQTLIYQQDNDKVKKCQFRLYLDWAENPHLRLRFSFLFIYLFIYVFVRLAAIVHALFNEQQPQSLTFLPFFSKLVHIVYCSQTHKFHFLITFSLKVGPTVLFTHLKIILLQYFSVFSFQSYPNRPYTLSHCEDTIQNSRETTAKAGFTYVSPSPSCCCLRPQ